MSETDRDSSQRRTSSPVGETVVDAISWELLRAGGNEDEITLNACVDDLDDDLLVGETDNKAVFRSVATAKN